MTHLKQAFIKTIPILCGYLFMGAAFGVLLQQAGFNSIWAFFASLTIYAGTGQFLLVSLLAENAALYMVAAMTLFINCRHIFYGISFIELFKKMGKFYPYMIFSLTDETYSVLCLYRDKKEKDNSKMTLFLIALLNHSYWIAGSVMGALIGQYIPVNFTGIEFSMTALFIVIFIDQQKNTKNHFPAVLGMTAAVICLIFLGSDRFLLPALIITITGICIAVKRKEVNKDDNQ